MEESIKYEAEIMLNIWPNLKESRVSRILCLGAHSDDIEIGCGGTLLRLLEELDDLEIWWIVFSGQSVRKKEAEHSAELFLKRAKKKKIIIKDYQDGFFQYRGDKIKNYFEKLKKMYNPDMIFSHYENDLHQDHKFISGITYQTFREQVILEYEVLKYDGDIGSPNTYFFLDPRTCKEKVDLLLKCFNSQNKKHWYSGDAFRSVLRIRGIESRAPSGYAEGFYCRKIAI